ncbi:flavin reductase (DIM6/NTAB) family NADH-FMN oxidoreductase RutF [Paraburkholderia sp. UCT70]
MSILRDEHADFSALFSGRAGSARKPEFVVPSQAPVLRAALAWFECERLDQHDIHDHTLFVATVTACESLDGAPLIFFASRYHDLRAT